MNPATITTEQMEDLLGLPRSGEQRAFHRLSGFEDASPDSIVFAQEPASLTNALSSAAGLILAPLGSALDPNGRVLPINNPKLAFALAGLFLESFRSAAIHPNARIDPAARLGEGTSVGAGAVIEAGAVIGHACSIGANVTVHGCAMIGDRVMVQAGAVLGSLGFGYVRSEDGAYVRFPQQGRLIIEDDVEIGANTTIDRGALGETRIGAGTKIDNLVHIGHNCRIGRNVILAAQVGISGSCVVEEGAVLAGQVGISDHCHIGPGVTLGGQTGVFRGKRVEGAGEVFAGTPAEPIKEYLKGLARVRRLK